MADNVTGDGLGDRRESTASNPSSPEPQTVKESSPEQHASDQGNQEESRSGQKQPKVWDDEETRSLIKFYKLYAEKFKNPIYKRKKLWQEIAAELHSVGYTKTITHVENRWKTLTAAYRRAINFNTTHSEKRKCAFFDELSEIYDYVPLYNEDPFEIVNGSDLYTAKGVNSGNEANSDDNYSVAKEWEPPRKLRLIRSHKSSESSDSFVKPSSSSKQKQKTVESQNKMSSGGEWWKEDPTSSLKKKQKTQEKKNDVYPESRLWNQKQQNAGKKVSHSRPMMYQCGLCGVMFKSSQQLHSHPCNPSYQNSENAQNVLQNENEAKVYISENKEDFEISLKPTGDAPIVKKKKWFVPTTWTIGEVMTFLRKYLKLESSASLFLYVNQAFAPSPDNEVGNVYECFNVNGTLVLHYSTSPAWG